VTFRHYYTSRTLTVRAHNSMKVTARSARINDGVDTGVEDRFGARQTPECVDRRDEECCSDQRQNHVVIRQVENKE
jgi:hypothetical protein